MSEGIFLIESLYTLPFGQKNVPFRSKLDISPNNCVLAHIQEKEQNFVFYIFVNNKLKLVKYFYGYLMIWRLCNNFKFTFASNRRRSWSCRLICSWDTDAACDQLLVIPWILIRSLKCVLLGVFHVSLNEAHNMRATRVWLLVPLACKHAYNQCLRCMVCVVSVNSIKWRFSNACIQYIPCIQSHTDTDADSRGDPIQWQGGTWPDYEWLGECDKVAPESSRILWTCSEPSSSNSHTNHK